MAKYLDSTGLTHLWAKIKTWVGNYVSLSNGTITIGSNTITPVTDVSGKANKSEMSVTTNGDSTTITLKTGTSATVINSHQDISGKVDKTTTVNGHALSGNVTVTASDIGVASGAEVNQNAFSNIKVGSTTIAADTKTDTLEFVGSGDVTITPDATNDKVTIGVTLPTKTSDLTNDSGFITTSDIPEGAAASTTTPKMDASTAVVGTETAFARGDHQHPTDTSRAAASHTHGNITNAGAITATGVAIANNDALVIVDNSASSKLVKTSIIFDGSTATKALTQKGTWETFNNYSHPTTTAVTAAAVKVGNDGLGHVVIGAALAKGDVGLGNVENKSSATIRGEITSSNVTTALGFTPANSANVGVANGICPLDANTKIAAQYLPSYVDDVVEAYARTGQTALSSTWLATGSASGTVITPEAGVIYVLMADSGDYTANSQFRWGGSAYVKLNDGGVSAITNAEIDSITSN